MMAEATGITDEARVVRDALRSLGYANAYDAPVAPWLCTEPIVVSMGEWERECRQDDGSERGRRALLAHVCCDDGTDARVTAREVARGLRGFDWAHAAAPPRMRVVACDVGRPREYGRDRSGRWVWDVGMTMTVVVQDG
jgi:hypothetical protein